MPASTQTLPSPTTTNFPNGISAGGIVGTGAIFVPGSTAIGLTAAAGGGQSGALLLKAQYNRVDTVGTAADSVKLPAPTYIGQEVEVMNNAAANSMQVFGSGTDTINGVATGTGVAQAAGKFAMYKASSIGTAAAWHRILSA
jgi:hypothetical protein